MLALLVVVALLVPAVPAAANAPVDDEAQIRAAFETAFDYSRPVVDRTRVIQRGHALRSALRWRDTYIALAGSEIRARIDTVRVYGNQAEVHFEFLRADTSQSIGGLVPFGIAVRREGMWKVSEHTVCEIAATVGDGCRGHDPSEEWRTRWQGSAFPLHRGRDGEHEVFPVTFADGTSVGLRLPRDLTIKKPHVRSQASLRVAGAVTSIFIVYRASHPPALTSYPSSSDGAVVLDYGGSLDFRIGAWTVMVDAAALAPSDRALVSRELRPWIDQSGMVVLETGSDLELHASAPPAGGSRSKKGPRVSDDLAPVVQITPAAGRRPFGALYLAHTGCRQATLDQFEPTTNAPLRCFDDAGVELSVEGGAPDFVARLLEESEIELVS